MKNFKSHFKFNKQERSGIFFLLLIIVLLQVGYFIYQSSTIDDNNSLELDSVTQSQIDDLRSKALVRDAVKIFPFNPNFITDYKGYTLGMSVKEIDRLHDFRATDKYVNSAEEFQKITQVSDSLLDAIAPYFKFPDWTNNTKMSSVVSRPIIKPVSAIKDLNTATVEDFQAINGIGEKLSARIVKFRNRLGGFLVDEQLYDVYGLEPEVVKRTLKKFKVINLPKIDKLNVNWASYNELRNLLYINDKLAKSIIEHRKKGVIKSLSELKTFEGFPEGRFERIKLYLSL